MSPKEAEAPDTCQLALCSSPPHDSMATSAGAGQRISQLHSLDNAAFVDVVVGKVADDGVADKEEMRRKLVNSALTFASFRDAIDEDWYVVRFRV